MQFQDSGNRCISQALKLKAAKKKQDGSMTRFVDRIFNAEKEKINEGLATFVFFCNIPDFIYSSDPFKELCYRMRPAYELPSYTTVKTQFLDSAYNELMERRRNYQKADGVLSLDVSSEGSDLEFIHVLAMLHVCTENATEKSVFLENKRFKCSIIRFQSIVVQDLIDELVASARDRYEMNVFAVLINSGDLPVEHGNLLIIPCSFYLVFDLMNSIIDSDDLNDTNLLLSEVIKLENCEQTIIDNGGKKMCIGSHMDPEPSLRSYLDNLKIIRGLVTDSSLYFEESIESVLFNESLRKKNVYYEKVYRTLKSVLAKTVDQKSSLSDFTEDYLTFLQLVDCFDSHLDIFIHNNPIFLMANFINPKYKGKKFSEAHQKIFDQYVLGFSESFLEDMRAYTQNNGAFLVLQQKINMKAMTFWYYAKQSHSELGDYAVRILGIPACIPKLPEFESNLDDSDIEIMDKHKAVYYALRLKTTNKSSKAS